MSYTDGQSFDINDTKVTSHGGDLYMKYNEQMHAKLKQDTHHNQYNVIKEGKPVAHYKSNATGTGMHIFKDGANVGTLKQDALGRDYVIDSSGFKQAHVDTAGNVKATMNYHDPLSKSESTVLEALRFNQAMKLY